MIKLKWKKKINEDDAQEQQSNDTDNGQQQANDSKVIALQRQKAAIVGQIRKDEDVFNQKKASYTAQLNALDTQIASLGGNITAESLEYKFSKNLYESVGSVGYTESLVSILKMTFDEIYSLSYVPSETSLETWSKNLINWLNKKISVEYWKTDGGNHLQEFIDKFKELTIDNLQYRGKWSSGEKGSIVENLENNIKESSMFKWLLGPDGAKTTE